MEKCIYIVLFLLGSLVLGSCEDDCSAVAEGDNQKNVIQLRLFYSFTIDSLGMLQNPISLPENILYPRNTGKTYDEFRDEALRVLQLMPAWEPAVNRIHGPASIDTGLFFYFNEEGKCGIE